MKVVYALMDAAMCVMMNTIQRRLASHACSPEAVEAYLIACAGITRDAYYAVPAASIIRSERVLRWRSPIQSCFPENNTAFARVFLSPAGWSAPAVFLLHALMSAHDYGYRKIAARFNRAGWNAVFVHLPFHYTRVPRGYTNGALAITADLPNNGETLRQAVVELRQLIAFLRTMGSREFGIVGTSYGGWVGALLAMMEADFRFVTLLQPIVDVEHAIWESPASTAIRDSLVAQGIEPRHTVRHAHLSSPMHGRPALDPERILIVGGSYDRIAPPRMLRRAAQAWGGARYVEVVQGHFGYSAMARALAETAPLLSKT